MLTEERKSELCKKCFYCCRALYIPIRAAEGIVDFYQKTRGVEIRFNGVVPWIILEHPCKNLTKTGCRIYDTRPIDCRTFDGRKDMFHPEKCLWNKEKE